MQTKLVILLLCALALAGQSRSQVSDSAKALFKKADGYVAERRYEEAARTYQQAAVLDSGIQGKYNPAYSGSCFRLAAIYYRRVENYQLTNECNNAAIAQFMKSDTKKLIFDILKDLGEFYDQTKNLPVAFQFPAHAAEETIIVYHSIDSILSRNGNRYTVQMDGGSNDGVFVQAEADVYGKYSARFKDRSSLSLGTARVTAVSYNTATVEVVLSDARDSAHLVYPGDMIAVPVRFPKSTVRNAFLKVSLLNIRFVDNNREWLAHPRTLMYYGSAALNDYVYQNMLNQVKEIYDTYKDEPKYRTENRISHGRFKGLQWMDAMGQSTEGDLRAFLGFILSFPGKYMGGTWKISETYATWLLNDCPFGATELMDSLLLAKEEDFKRLVLANKTQIKDNFFDRWQIEAQDMAYNKEFELAHQWNGIIQRVAVLMNDADLRGWASFNLGKILDEEARYDEAVAAYQKGMPEFEKSGNSKALSFCVNNIGFIYSRRYEYPKAVEMYGRVRAIRAKNLAADSSIDNRISFASACSGEGDNLYNQSNYQGAIHSYAAGVAVIEKLHDLDARKRLALLFRWIGKSYENMGDYEAATGYYEKEYHMRIALGDKEAQADALDNQGYLLSKVGRYREAYRIYGQAFELHEQAGNKSDAAFSRSNMGQVLFSLGQYDSAIVAHQEAIGLRRQTADRKGEAYSWKKLGALYAQSGDVGKSSDAYQKALDIYQQIEANEEYGELLESMAEQSQKIRDMASSRRYYQQALDLYRKINNRQKQATVYTSLGNLLYGERLYPEADSFYNQALDIQQNINDRTGMMYSYTNKGLIAQFSREDYAGAIRQLSLALKLAEETSSESNLAFCRKKLGELYASINQNDSASRSYQKSLDLYTRLGDREGEADIYADFAYLKNYQGQYKEAYDYFFKALQIGQSTQNAYIMANAYTGISGYHQILGHFTEALDTMNKAMDIYREKKNPWGIAALYKTLADIRNNQGEFTEALDYYRQADSMYQELKMERPGIYIANNKGTIYYHQHNYDEALRQFQLSLGRLEKYNDDPVMLALLKSNIGEVYLEQKDWKKSDTWLRESLEMGNAQHNRRQLYMSHTILGRLRGEEKNYPEAAAHFRVADSLTRGESEVIFRIQLMQQWGYMLYQSGRMAEAETKLQECISLSQRIGYRNYIWRAYETLSDIRLGQNRAAEAVEALQNAVRVVEEIKARISNTESLYVFANDESIVELYEKMVVLLKNQGRINEAIVFKEKAHQENIKLRTHAEEIRYTDPATRDALAGEENLRRKEALYDRELTEEKAKPEALRNTEKIGKLEQMRSVAASEYKAYVTGLKQKYPNLQAFKTVDPDNFMAERRRIPPDVAVVSYLVTEQEMSVFVVMRDTIFVKDIPVNRQLLQTKIRNFYTLHARSARQAGEIRGGKVSASQPAGKENREDLAADLYDLLIKPVMPAIASKSSVAIVPSGNLCFVPFDALGHRSEKGEMVYFGEEKQLFYVNKISTITSSSNEELTDMRMVAVGNADKSLPNAETEVKMLETAIPHTTVYLRDQATRKNVLENTNNYNVLHLATHGVLDYSDAGNSYLVLAADPANHDDGRLTIAQIQAMTDIDRFRLITLSACETAVIREVAEGWPISTASAFLEMGVPTVIATLWQVDDKATSLLMEKFYENLKTMDKVQALQQAQLYLKAQPAYADPYFWAPFQLVGTWK